MQKPSLSKVPKEVITYIEFLEARLAIIDNNADVEIYVSLNKQLSNISNQIAGATFDINDKDDIAFERFLELTVKSKTVSENMAYFRNKLTPEQIKKRSDAAAEEHIFEQQ